VNIYFYIYIVIYLYIDRGMLAILGGGGLGVSWRHLFYPCVLRCVCVCVSVSNFTIQNMAFQFGFEAILHLFLFLVGNKYNNDNHKTR